MDRSVSSRHQIAGFVHGGGATLLGLSGIALLILKGLHIRELTVRKALVATAVAGGVAALGATVYKSAIGRPQPSNTTPSDQPRPSDHEEEQNAPVEIERPEVVSPGASLPILLDQISHCRKLISTMLHDVGQAPHRDFHLSHDRLSTFVSRLRALDHALAHIEGGANEVFPDSEQHLALTRECYGLSVRLSRVARMESVVTRQWSTATTRAQSELLHQTMDHLSEWLKSITQLLDPQIELPQREQMATHSDELWRAARADLERLASIQQ